MRGSDDHDRPPDGVAVAGLRVVEPIALAAGACVRNLQQFLKACDWTRRPFATGPSASGGRRRRATRRPGRERRVIDETSCLKQGAKTPGVQRQYLGCVGKLHNGIVTVHLACARGRFQCLVGRRVVLAHVLGRGPNSVPGRRHPRRCPLPPHVADRLRPGALGPWQRVFVRLAHLRRGVRRVAQFLRLLDAVGQRFVGEVPVTFPVRVDRSRRGWRPPRVRPTGADSQGRPGVPVAHADRAVSLSGRSSSAAVPGAVRCPRHRLLIAPIRVTAEVKYFVTNARSGVALGVLAASFPRCHVEHVFRLAKSEVGLMHYEGRHYPGLALHLVPCTLVLGFVSLHTERLRGENPHLTLEQVCRSLNVRFAGLLRRQRGSAHLEFAAEVIRYHRARNAAAKRRRLKLCRRSPPRLGCRSRFQSMITEWTSRSGKCGRSAGSTPKPASRWTSNSGHRPSRRFETKKSPSTWMCERTTSCGEKRSQPRESWCSWSFRPTRGSGSIRRRPPPTSAGVPTGCHSGASHRPSIRRRSGS